MANNGLQKAVDAIRDIALAASAANLGDRVLLQRFLSEQDEEAFEAIVRGRGRAPSSRAVFGLRRMIAAFGSLVSELSKPFSNSNRMPLVERILGTCFPFETAQFSSRSLLRKR